MSRALWAALSLALHNAWLSAAGASFGIRHIRHRPLVCPHRHTCAAGDSPRPVERTPATRGSRGSACARSVHIVLPSKSASGATLKEGDELAMNLIAEVPRIRLKRTSENPQSPQRRTSQNTYSRHFGE